MDRYGRPILRDCSSSRRPETIFTFCPLHGQGARHQAVEGANGRNHRDTEHGPCHRRCRRGRAGCNSYFASYRVNGSGISIGQPGATSRLCTEPAGVMEQEAQFPAALQSALNFRIDGNKPAMRSVADQIAVVASRVP